MTQAATEDLKVAKDLSLDWSLLFRQMPASCVVLDRDLCIVTASDLYLRSVTREMEEIRGQYLFDAFPEDPANIEVFRDAFQRALDGEANIVLEMPYFVERAEGDPPGDRNCDLYWTCQQAPLVEPDGTIRYMILHATDVSEMVRAERLKDAIAGELQHRVRNLLTLVSAIAKRTAANSEDLEEFLDKFQARMMSFARTHADLTGDNREGMTIRQIVAREIEGYAEATDRITVSGSRVVLNSAEAQIMTLAIHELATNSVKHGALRSETGHIRIEWAATERGGYTFDWREAGIAVGPAPDRKGFGSFILDTVAPDQLQGSATREFAQDGLLYSLAVADRPGIAQKH